MKNKPEVSDARFQVPREGGLPLLETENLKLETYSAFTLIELLVVISIIAVIAALILAAGGAAKRFAATRAARAEMARIETAIGRYKAAYGFYPPDNADTANNLSAALTNQLYYELAGTTFDPTNDTYTTLDGSVQISAGDIAAAFGVGGFMNCNKPGADESATPAQDFLPGLKPDQIGWVAVGDGAISNLITSAGGPSPNYRPLGVRDVNPWRYNSSNPTNNPGSYDLWVQLNFGSRTDLVCNWNKQVQINSPWP